jgi:hypothetical protein
MISKLNNSLTLFYWDAELPVTFDIYQVNLDFKQGILSVPGIAGYK